jgi:general secretion pathway protein D
MINVEKMPLSDFIIYALGETLKVPFITDQKVMDNKEPITFSMPQPMPSDKALEIVLGLFERYNLNVEEKAGALYILHKSPEPKQPFDVRIGREVPESSAQIFQVVPLKHIRPHEIGQLVGDLYKTTSVQIRLHPKGENVILLYGQASQVKQIVEFIETFDVPYLQGKKIIVFKLTYWQIDDFVKQISQIFEGIGLSVAKSPKDPGVLFIPIKPLGSLLVIAPDDISLKYVLHWKEKLDTPEASGAEERPFVYIPKYARASDLVKSIRNLYGVMPAPAAPAVPATPTTPARPPTPQPAQLEITGLKISSDDQKNIIMVVSTAAEYKKILTLLTELDVPPRQVLIEATVAEFTLTDDLKYGLEWYIKNRMFEGTSNLQSLVGMTEGTGLVYQFLTDTKKFQVVVNAFASQDRVNILSTPRLIVLDNQEAMIQVGTDVPIVTSEVTAADVTQTVPSVLRSIQYRSTGVILRIKPTINTEGLLTLNISQEVSEMGTNPPGMSSPTILTRKITTSVVAAHGESIALGGLMSENKSWGTSKIPFLGDIPVIGPLFKTTSKENRKTELLIFLTPTILTTIDETSKITRDLKKELKWLK